MTWQELFNEKLTKVSLLKLEDQMNKNSKLDTFLNTKIKDLDSRYLQIFDLNSISDSQKNMTLYEVIEAAESNSSDFRTSRFFSETESGDYVGWCFYTKDVLHNVIQDVGLFSFDLEHPSLTMVRDFFNLIKELSEEYREIRFVVNKSNPAEKTYDKALNKLDVPFDKDEDDDLIYYTVYQKRFFENIVKKRKNRL